jgi:acyl-CoA dehydrogenase
MRRTVFPLGRPYVVPSDRLGHDVARLVIEPSATRDRLTAGMYLPKSENDILGAIEAAVEATLAAEPIEARIRETQKAGRLVVKVGEDRPAAALAAGVIDTEELAVVRRAKRLLDQVVRVDDFAQDLGVSELRPPANGSATPGSFVRREAA